MRKEKTGIEKGFTFSLASGFLDDKQVCELNLGPFLGPCLLVELDTASKNYREIIQVLLPSFGRVGSIVIIKCHVQRAGQRIVLLCLGRLG